MSRFDPKGPPIVMIARRQRVSAGLPAAAGWAAVAIGIVAGGGCERTAPSATGGQTLAPAGAATDIAPMFRDVTAAVGLDSCHQTEPPGNFFLPEINGSGCALFDCDRDGRLDIFLPNLGTGYGVDPYRAAPSVRRGSRLYHQTADGRFEDVTERSGLGDPGFAIGAAVGDVNNDGSPDLYVTAYGADHLYLNRGDGTFVDVTVEAGIDNPVWGVSAGFCDYDRDGWLDLYVANYVNYRRVHCTRVGGGDEDYCGPHMFPPLAHKLYHNETGGLLREPASGESARPRVRFADVSIAAGITERKGRGMGVACVDFNGDGWPDIFVSNDRMENFLWLNRGNGRFDESAMLHGCAFDAQGRAHANMGIAVGDVDGNGTFDLLVTGLDGEAHALYLGSADGVFQDEASVTGLAGPTIPHTGFGTALADVDQDGDLDVVVVNGAVKRTDGRRLSDNIPRELAAFWHPYAEANQLFLNDGTGHFREFVCPADPLVTTAEVSRGLAVGDVDNDGALDLLVSNVAGPARLYRNVTLPAGNWLQIQALNPHWGGRDDYGAVITVSAGAHRWCRLVSTGFSYLSASDPRAHFGLGDARHVDRIVVRWSDGVEEQFPGVEANQRLVVKRGTGKQHE